jgi:putative hydrolase of the HAD superfamily
LTRSPALVVDFGGPVLLTPFELTAAAESRLGLPPGALGWTGPFGPDQDQDWQDVLLHGRLGERDYWARRADDFSRATGQSTDTRGLIAALYTGEPRAFMRPGALVLLREARGAGRPVGVLTNDLRAFHSGPWVDVFGLDELVDVVVDGSVEGVLKPDPRIYRLIAAHLRTSCEEIVFLDDQPVNLAGAEAVGMTAVPVDVTDPEAAFARARELLGLPPSDA